MQSSARSRHARPAATGWLGGLAYLRQGLALTRRDPALYLLITIVFSVPSAIAVGLVVAGSRSARWEQVVLLTFPWITASVGPVVVMMAVSYHANGRSVSLGRATLDGLAWLPRYLWTNAHTGIIFWIPVGLLLELRALTVGFLPDGGPSRWAVEGLWWILIGVVALALHTRTLLAPFLAVHDDLPATLATLESWRLSGQNFRLCLSTFVVASLPVTLVAGLLSLGLLVALPEPGRLVLFTAAANLLLIVIQCVRPILIPAVYRLHKDLWQAERERRAVAGAPRVPLVARVLLALTRPLPRPGRRTGNPDAG